MATGAKALEAYGQQVIHEAAEKTQALRAENERLVKARNLLEGFQVMLYDYDGGTLLHGGSVLQFQQREPDGAFTYQFQDLPAFPYEQSVCRLVTTA